MAAAASATGACGGAQLPPPALRRRRPLPCSALSSRKHLPVLTHLRPRRLRRGVGREAAGRVLAARGVRHAARCWSAYVCRDAPPPPPVDADPPRCWWRTFERARHVGKGKSAGCTLFYYSWLVALPPKERGSSEGSSPGVRPPLAPGLSRWRALVSAPRGSAFGQTLRTRTDDAPLWWPGGGGGGGGVPVPSILVRSRSAAERGRVRSRQQDLDRRTQIPRLGFASPAGKAA